MNTEIHDAVFSSPKLPAGASTPPARQAAVLAGQFLSGLIKCLIVSTPLLSMMLMILALWGVVGKARYPDLEAARQAQARDVGDAKNYLVNETKPVEQCPEAVAPPDTGAETERPMPGKIDWAHAV